MIATLCGLVGESRVAKGPNRLVMCGSGHRDILSDLPHCRALVSLGIAGAVHPRMGVGDILLATSVRGMGVMSVNTTQDWRWRMAAACRRKSFRIWEGPIFSSSVVRGVTPADRALISQVCSAWAVDDESYAVARAAIKMGLPFAVVRAISDTAEQTIPSAALVSPRPDGSHDLLAICRELTKRPLQVFALLKIARQYKTALASLRGALDALGPELAL